MNTSNLGQAVFQVCNASKPKRINKKRNSISNEKCEYCYKKTTSRTKQDI